MTQRRNIDRLTSEMEELFADLWYHRLAPQRSGFRPRVDVYRKDGATRFELKCSRARTPLATALHAVRRVRGA